MATLAQKRTAREPQTDVLSGIPRAHPIDRWIFVFMAAWFIVVTLTGFIPDSITKVGAIEAGARPPFPLVLHLHGLLMGTFLLLVLAQTTLAATGRIEAHRWFGMAAFVLAPALVLIGFILVPTMYDQTWNALQSATGAQREALQKLLAGRERIMIVQFRAGILFPLFLGLGLRARKSDAGFHKRMMILATATGLPFGIDRITWLPSNFPASFVAIDSYALLAVSPMFIWDVVRNHRVHQAYLIWFGVNLPVALLVYRLWDTPWWHELARHIMGA